MPSQDYEEFIAASGPPGQSRMGLRPRADRFTEKQGPASLRRLGEL
jgi:hypothetical protein